MIIFILSIKLPQTWFRCRRRFAGGRRLDGQTVIITGANSGIGKELAYQLSLRGPKKIIIGSRNPERNEKAVRDVLARNPSANITALRLDLSSLKSVREFAKAVADTESRVDILVNNAGGPPPEGPDALMTLDGYEHQFVANYLGHFLLSLHLLPLLRRSPDARIINVAETGHIFGNINLDNINLGNGEYGHIKAHCQAKLAVVLSTREMARRVASTGGNNTVKTYCVNPGIVNTRGGKNVVSGWLKVIFMLGIEMGPQTYMHCALDESTANESGHYYDNCRRVDSMHSKTVDDKIGHQLWELSEDMVKLEDQYRLPKHIKI
ncbi:unnamed protein product [Medioppia subpectinata]|uniref:Uncharacterized protein n=1 Tax=Medioppia subpectinata TaxID=1979941 RepID=A0A7R9KIA7_9ACAR|nr:unnamed protein product [Medioppia subpectinata]CAG2103979.1 unnamed protein product [Medioppia subpectinata]